MAQNPYAVAPALPPPVAVTPFSLDSPASDESRGTPLSIGDVTFRDAEHPQELELGVEQMLAVHQNIGGSKVVHSLGAIPKQYTWEGRLWDATAEPRVKRLLRMAADGQNVMLKYASFRYDVVVKDFVPKAYNQWLWTYKITVEVVRDRSGAYAGSSLNTTQIDQQTQSLVQQCQIVNGKLGAIDATGSSTLQTQINNVATSVLNLGPIASSSGSSVLSTVATIRTAIGAAQTYVSTVTSLIGNSTSISQTLSQQFAYANRILTNLQLVLTNIQSGQVPVSTQVNGGSLYALAAKYYGDVSLAPVIKQANNLVAYTLPQGVLQTIIIPPQQQSGSVS